MRCGLDLRVSLPDSTVSSNQVADPARLTGISRFRGTVGHGDSEILIAEQIEFELILVVEFPVLGRCIIADTKDDRVPVAQLLDSITEPLPLAGSARCAGSGIEPEYDVLAAEVLQGHLLTILIQEAEWRSFVAFS